MLGSNLGQLRMRHWQSDALTTRLDLVLTRLELIHILIEDLPSTVANAV
jgi:hypothetical protein